MINVLLVFVGGGLGSLLRYGITFIFPKSMDGYPTATFVANVISCLLLGYLLGLSSNSTLSDSSKLLLITGFCGGFSTFSTFAGENYQLIENQQYGIAFLYAFLSFGICLAAIFLGLRLSQ